MNSSHRAVAAKIGSEEETFQLVVRQYANLVYSVAKRRLGNPSLAEEATQIVFIRLAAGPKLESIACLASWLHREALRVSVDLWRSESRRRIREEKSMESQGTEEKSTWDELAPHLDAALDQLNDEERQLLLLRFFERQRFAEVGTALAISEAAAKCG